MSKKVYRPGLLAQAKKVLSAWIQIDEQLALGPFTTARLVTTLNRAEGFQNEIRDLENRLTDLRNRRDANEEEIWSIVKGVRLGVRFIFGEDSSEYEMVGGTRTSEHKSPRRAAAPAES